jgi:hypothetical protein
MLHFWYTKFLMRFIGLIAFAGFAFIVYYAYVNTSPVETFDSQKQFTQQSRIQNKNNPLVQSIAETPVDEPNLSERELQNWVTMVVSESLAFQSGSVFPTYVRVADFYEREGMRQYQEFLKESNIVTNVMERGYQLSVLVEQQPLLLNSGALGGVYRWLYQVPITISFVPANVSDLYGQDSQIVTRKLTLRVQIKRTPKQYDPNAIQIESWKVSPRR